MLSGRKKIIWTNGCFDVLHIGHAKMLEYAKSLGDELWVGIDSNERVKELKGASRPINSDCARMLMLYHIKWVDKVFIFTTDFQLSEMTKEADEMVVGEEYRDKRIIGSENVKRVHFFPRIGNFSTTRIINGS